MSLKLTNVTRDPAADQVLKDFSIDRPVAASDDGHLIEISGWAVGRGEAREVFGCTEPRRASRWRRLLSS